MATRSLETLLRGVLDYAGMFPPAGLAIGDAMTMYARYRAGANGWMVGTFVVSAERLEELGRDRTHGVPVSVVLSTPSPAGIERVLRSADRMAIAAIEFRPVPSDEVPTLAAAVPDDIEAYFEVPPDDDLDRRLDAIVSCGRSAKIRTGGVTPDSFPTASAVYRFLRACADRRLRAKATAGLHHAVSGCYPLTYEATSASAPMYGFLNVCAAAALVHTGMTEEHVFSVLGESSPAAFRFHDAGMEWRGHGLPTSDLAAARETLFGSFGSCSLHEPIDDLQRMRML